MSVLAVVLVIGLAVVRSRAPDAQLDTAAVFSTVTLIVVTIGRLAGLDNGDSSSS